MIRDPHIQLRAHPIGPQDENAPILAGFTRRDFERLNRIAHAKNLRAIIQSTKWLNSQSMELLAQFPNDFFRGAGLTCEEFKRALQVHVDSCCKLLERL
jgi:hypothetical protein